VRATQQGALANLLSLQSTPLQSLLSFGFVSTVTPPQASTTRLLAAFLDTRIEALLTSLQTVCLQVSQLSPWLIRIACARLLSSARRPVAALGQMAEANPALRQRMVGDTTLRDYVQSNAASIDRWQHALTEARALHLAMQGNNTAFAKLVTIHKQAVIGAIRARTWHDQNTDDIAQNTWLQVWQKMTTYDPSIGTFLAFAKYYARIMCLRSYDKKNKHLLHTITVHDVPQTVQELDNAMSRLVLYEQALQATFASTSPPHQLLSFALCKLLTLQPEAIVSSVFDIPLRLLAQQFEVAYIKAVAPPLHRVLSLQASLAPLHAMMDYPLHDVCFDDRTRQTYPDLLGCIVGETTLRQYYEAARKAAEAKGEETPTPQAKVTHWWHAVTRRVSRDLKS
jgi:DNA-directed RNA polymerase specialized sigma24 family protein